MSRSSEPIRDSELLEKAIRQALTDTEVSLREIDTQTGVSRTTLSGFLNGSRGLTLENLFKLADFFKIRYEFKNF